MVANSSTVVTTIDIMGSTIVKLNAKKPKEIQRKIVLKMILNLSDHLKACSYFEQRMLIYPRKIEVATSKTKATKQGINGCIHISLKDIIFTKNFFLGIIRRLIPKLIVNEMEELYIIFSN